MSRLSYINSLIELTRNYYDLILLLFKLINITGSLHEATALHDMKLSYDITIGETRISIRIRNTNFRDFTVRTTEYPKLRTKPTNYYFYAWTDKSNNIDLFMILDIPTMQANNIFNYKRSTIPNNDGTSFCAIPLKEIKDYIVLKEINIL